MCFCVFVLVSVNCDQIHRKIGRRLFIRLMNQYIQFLHLSWINTTFDLFLFMFFDGDAVVSFEWFIVESNFVDCFVVLCFCLCVGFCPNNEKRFCFRAGHQIGFSLVLKQTVKFSSETLVHLKPLLHDRMRRNVRWIAKNVAKKEQGQDSQIT